MTREEYIQLSDSCNFLERYHLELAEDREAVSQFRGKSNDSNTADIYIVSDPTLKQHFRRLVEPFFPEDSRLRGARAIRLHRRFRSFPPGSSSTNER